MISGTETHGDNVLRVCGRQPVPGQGGENQKACTTYEFFQENKTCANEQFPEGQAGADWGRVGGHECLPKALGLGLTCRKE